MMQTGRAKSWLRTQVIHLTVLCPYDLTNPCTCPLYEIRKKSSIERLDWVDLLTDEEAANILSNHQQCLNEKLAGQ
jgi:hypothetical protein